MDVLELTQRFPPALGGVENHVLNLAEGLSKEGIHVAVFATDLLRDIPFERMSGDAPSVPFPVRRFRAVKILELPHGLGIVSPGMLLGALTRPADVIHAHAHGYFPTFAGAFAARLRGVPLVLTLHTDPGRRVLRKRAFDRLVSVAVLRHARRIIALTRLEREHLASSGVSADRVVVIPNGVDLREFPDIGPRAPTKESITLLFVGRCYLEQKGLDILVRAVAALPPWVCLRIVGEDWGGHRVVRELSASLGVSDRVTLAGRVDRPTLLKEYTSADVFVLPSHFESFPIVLLEAMAAGLPVVATRVGGVPDIVADGETGLLVDPGAPQALARAIDRLASDSTLRARMGRRARERAAGFSWDVVVPQVRDLFEEVLAEGV